MCVLYGAPSPVLWQEGNEAGAIWPPTPIDMEMRPEHFKTSLKFSQKWQKCANKSRPPHNRHVIELDMNSAFRMGSYGPC